MQRKDYMRQPLCGAACGALLLCSFAASAQPDKMTDLVRHWSVDAVTNVVPSCGRDALVGCWKTHRWYVRRDTKQTGGAATVKGESVEQFQLEADGAANGFIKIKNGARTKYKGSWSYENDILTMPSNTAALTNNIAYRVIWHSHDEIELRFTKLVFNENGLDHCGCYDAAGNLSLRSTHTSQAGDVSTVELEQSPSLFKRQKKH